MNFDAAAADTLRRHVAARAPWRPDPADQSPACCPRCGAPPALDPAWADDPDRFVGACKARGCG
jgi:hypothetical protein